MIGTTIGKYRIVEKLGRGGMGTVYKAVDETLDREVAVKVLNSDVDDSTLMARFRAEAKTVARLNHPQIATIYEIYRSDTDLLMVMELVRGETLDKLSSRVGPLPPEQAASLIVQVLGALAHAHRAGIVHRDLKPANLMITESGTIKVMDFGIARVLGAEHLTMDGMLMGTPAYMAPEQVMGQDVDARTDLYSVGVVFYRLLSACLPFQADTPIAIVHKQLSDPPTPLSVYRADLPDWCETILDRALAKEPAKRFQSAEEFRSALVSAIGHSHTGVSAIEYMPPVFAPPAAAARPVASATPPHGVSPEDLTELAPAQTSVGEPTPVALSGTSDADLDVTQFAPAVADVGEETLLAPSPVPEETMLAPSPLSEETILAPAPVPEPAVPAAAPALAGEETLLAKPMPRSGASPAAKTGGSRTGTYALLGIAAAVVVAGVLTMTVFRGASPASSPQLDEGSANSATAPAVASATEPIASQPAVDNAAAAPSAASAAATDAAAMGANGTGAGRSGTTPAVAPTAAARRPTAPAPAPLESSPIPADAHTATPAAAALALPPLVFSAQTVVVEGGRNRQRDSTVQVANGALTVTGRDNKVITSVPFDSVVGFTYSNSKQPLWNSPQGPAEIAHLDGGAFGFLKGDQHWVSLRTTSMSLVLRVRDQDSRRVVAGIEERTGKKVEVVTEK